MPAPSRVSPRLRQRVSSTAQKKVAHRGENRDDQLGQAHGEGVDVPGGVAEEAMKPRPVSVSDTATGEDDFGHVAVTLRDDPARDDHHECLVGRGRENRSEVL